jgi:hypothetical protein
VTITLAYLTFVKSRGIDLASLALAKPGECAEHWLPTGTTALHPRIRTHTRPASQPGTERGERPGITERLLVGRPPKNVNFREVAARFRRGQAQRAKRPKPPEPRAAFCRAKQTARRVHIAASDHHRRCRQRQKKIPQECELL